MSPLKTMKRYWMLSHGSHSRFWKSFFPSFYSQPELTKMIVLISCGLRCLGFGLELWWLLSTLNNSLNGSYMKMSNLESRTNIILFGPHNALSRCNISKQETFWGSENTMKIPYSIHIWLIPIFYNVLGHNVFCAVYFLIFAQWTVFPNAVIVRWQTFRIKEKEYSAGIVVFYERNKTNVCSGVFERRYNAALIYGSFKSHIMPALTIAIYCSCIIHFFYLSNFMIIWKSQKVKLQSPGLIFISMIK